MGAPADFLGKGKVHDLGATGLVPVLPQSASGLRLQREQVAIVRRPQHGAHRHQIDSDNVLAPAAMRKDQSALIVPPIVDRPAASAVVFLFPRWLANEERAAVSMVVLRSCAAFGT